MSVLGSVRGSVLNMHGHGTPDDPDKIGRRIWRDIITAYVGYGGQDRSANTAASIVDRRCSWQQRTSRSVSNKRGVVSLAQRTFDQRSTCD